ncbi:MAG: cytochrome-c peroxidase [Deinococcales bacterium]|nr:cytochrome-c peroxidase [Deinococcales bacterium]
MFHNRLRVPLVAFLALGVFAVVSVAAAQEPDQLQRTAQALFAPLPDVVDNPDNPVTAEKVELGKMLYYDPRLSLSGVFSCNSCHNIATYGVDNLETSTGHGWAQGPRNSPTVMNAAVHSSQFWDGRAKDVEEQAQGPVLNPIEMGIPHADFAVERIASMPVYGELFAKAFPDQSEPLVYTNIANAIGAFERTLTTPSRFDDYLNGDADALSEQELAGLQTFIEYGCAGCHNGAALGGNSLQRFGVTEAYWEATRDFVAIDSPTMPMDVGRFAVTHDEADLYVFKVPSLRNITRTYPYFHDGSVWSLRDATQIMARVQLGRELGEQELDDLMAFYGALEGTIPEYALQLPVLPASTDATPRPDHR